MSKKNRRAFPAVNDGARIGARRSDASRDKDSVTIHEGERASGVFGFFRDHGVRETIESILVAVVLALLFRAYEAEAFIIPTGSMAPTLQGQHMDVICEKCQYPYRTGASLENSTYPPQSRDRVENTVCPICQYEMRMSRNKNPDHRSHNGDRILVNKFVYDFAEPERFDVIVFKNPNNGKQNYIKRLIGLPSENLLIDSGDIYQVDPDGQGGWINKRIVRKPPDKLKVMLQVVDDTKYIAPELTKVGWPSRWQQWEDGDAWQEITSGEATHYYIKPSDNTNWLRYRHLIPRRTDWESIDAGRLPSHIVGNQLGQIIGDYYCYNDRIYARRGEQRSPAAHWVGDLALECWAEVKSESGTLLFGLVEGGANFECSIDISSGAAELSCSDSTVTFMDEDGVEVAKPTATTSIKGAGKYRVVYANADDRIYLWINNQVIEFDAPYYQRTGEVIPKWSQANPGDAEPAGVGARNAEVNITRLRVSRDVYYSSTLDKEKIHNETTFFDGVTRPAPRGVVTIRSIHEDPRRWESRQGKEVFRSGKGVKNAMFPLEADQFLPMGDNSPASLDGRVWQGPRYVPCDMMIGRAMFTYWPHSLNKPIPFFPNFKRMGFIR